MAEPRPPHLRLRMSPMGYLKAPPISGIDGYGGQVEVYESSSGQPGIWIATTGSLNDAVSTVLVSLPHVRQLIEQLVLLHNSHYTDPKEKASAPELDG